MDCSALTISRSPFSVTSPLCSPAMSSIIWPVFRSTASSSSCSVQECVSKMPTRVAVPSRPTVQNIREAKREVPRDAAFKRCVNRVSTRAAVPSRPTVRSKHQGGQVGCYEAKDVKCERPVGLSQLEEGGASGRWPDTGWA